MPDYTVKLDVSSTGPQCALTVRGPAGGEEVFRIRWSRLQRGMRLVEASGPASGRLSAEQVFDMVEAADCCLDDPSQQEALEKAVNDIMQED